MRTEEPNVQALIVVDVQRAFVEGVDEVPDVGRLLSTIRIQLAAARTVSAHAVYLQNAETGDGCCGTSLESVLREGKG